MGIPAETFSQVFASDAAKQATQDHFRQATQWGIHGFPSVIAQDVAGLSFAYKWLLSSDTLRQRIDTWLVNTGFDGNLKSE